jgi:ATP-dependent Lon protease
MNDRIYNYKRMVHDNKNKSSKKEQKYSKKEEINKKKKYVENSDSDDMEEIDSDETDDSENDEMDVHEFRKYVHKIFPSKDLSKKIKAGEKLKKKIQKYEKEQEENSESEEEESDEEYVPIKKNKQSKHKKKVEKYQEESSDEDEEDDIWETASEKEEIKKKSKKTFKKNKNKSKKIEKESDEEESEEEASESEDEKDIKGSNKVNIIFTIGNGKNREDEWFSEDDEYDSDYEDDHDDDETEDEDESVSSIFSDEEEEDEDEDEEQEENPKKKMKKTTKNTKDKQKEEKNKETNDKKKEEHSESEEEEENEDKKDKKKKKNKKEDCDKNTDIENTILPNGKSTQDILDKLKELLSSNPNDKSIKKCIDIYQEDLKKEKGKREKKEKKQKAKNLRIFKKIVKDKNTMNDFGFYEKLEMLEQKKIIKELKEINKITRIEKPYRMTLLESSIPVHFKAAAMKKINSLRYMEPGSGEFYKIKNWVDTFMRIPFGKIEELPINIDNGVEQCHDFMENAQKTLDSAVYGLNDAKMQIMQMLGQLLTNPKAIGTAIAIHGPPGTGKCMVRDTPILMHDGSIKKVQDVKVGDWLMGDDSTPRHVLSLGSGKDELYDVVPVRGETYGVNSEHILCLKVHGLHTITPIKHNNPPIVYKVEYFNKETYQMNSNQFVHLSEAETFLQAKQEEDDIVEISVKTWLTLPESIQSKLQGYSVGVHFPSKSVPIDPYILASWIATKDHIMSSPSETDILLQGVEEWNLDKNRHIPTIYKINDKHVQSELLAGFIDSTGSYSDTKRCYEITQQNKQLCEDIVFVARSLGFSGYMEETKEEEEYTITISGNQLHEIPVKHAKNKATEQKEKKRSMNMTMTQIKIVSKGRGEYYGFELDGNHRYLLGHFTVTHNTSLVKEGISKILNRPFAFIALGGATDSSFLEGHGYTYEGSTWGKIVQILIDSQCMNPVIYFDELDKISDTPRGEEIAGILTHLTDTSQNSQFHDKYFAEINFDLSKCLFIFSYNDESKVNAILKDRMYRIKTKGYSGKEKTVISNQYLLPKIREQIKFMEEDIVIPDVTVTYLIETYCNSEDGVRNLKRCLEIIHTKLNLYRLMKPNSNIFESEMSLKVEFPFTVTKEIVDKLIKREDDNTLAVWRNMFV